MEHIFLIDITENTGYNKYTIEAVREFLDLFPEYKDQFKIHLRAGDKFFEIPLSELEKNNPTLNSVDYSRFDNTIDLSTITGTNTKAVNGWLGNNAFKDSFFHYICPTKQKIDGGLLFGVSSQLTLSEGNVPEEKIEKYRQTSYTLVNTNRDEEEFKSILKHELGHAFHATEDGREHVKNFADTGCHCGNPGCLMEDGRENEASQGKKPDFCPDCIAAMKKYVGSLFNENSRTNSNTATNENREDSQFILENDDGFKNQWRIYSNLVRKSLDGKSTFQEDKTSHNFSAKITTPDGVETSIVATHNNSVALSAKKPDGTPTVPDQKFFDELAKKAISTNQTIAFGNIKSSEFKARLMLACLKQNVEMLNHPEISELLGMLDNESPTKKALAAFANKEQKSQNPVSISQLKDDVTR